MESSDYASLVTRAEEAVRPVKDAELRKVAFEKVLDDLLHTSVKATAVRKSSDTSKSKVAKVTRQPKTRGGPKAYVEELLEEGYFKKQKTITQVKTELVNRGHHIPVTSLSGPLQMLCQRRKLRRQKTKADKNKKPTFVYSEW